MGELEVDAGNAASARTLLEKVIRLDPAMPHAYASLARLEAGAGNYARARKVFGQGAEATNGNPPLLHVCIAAFTIGGCVRVYVCVWGGGGGQGAGATYGRALNGARKFVYYISSVTSCVPRGGTCIFKEAIASIIYALWWCCCCIAAAAADHQFFSAHRSGALFRDVGLAQGCMLAISLFLACPMGAHSSSLRPSIVSWAHGCISGIY
eukprot:1159724-Pelagomonas_calceolata.AAC.11